MKKFTKKMIIMLMTSMLTLGAATVSFAAEDTTATKVEGTTIEESDTPLAAAEDKCGIHWIVLLLSTGVVGYYAVRIIAESKAAEREVNKQEA